ncbi:unnamed protein product, partial [Rotaria socialis]
MNSTREFHRTSVLSNGQVLVCGGYNGGSLNGAELYDPTTGNWSVTVSMNYARNHHTATLVSEKVLVAGGYGV